MHTYYLFCKWYIYKYIVYVHVDISLFRILMILVFVLHASYAHAWWPPMIALLSDWITSCEIGSWSEGFSQWDIWALGVSPDGRTVGCRRHPPTPQPSLLPLPHYASPAKIWTPQSKSAWVNISESMNCVENVRGTFLCRINSIVIQHRINYAQRVIWMIWHFRCLPCHVFVSPKNVWRFYLCSSLCVHQNARSRTSVKFLRTTWKSWTLPQLKSVRSWKYGSPTHTQFSGFLHMKGICK